jgi:hypothetical protein
VVPPTLLVRFRARCAGRLFKITRQKRQPAITRRLSRERCPRRLSVRGSEGRDHYRLELDADVHAYQLSVPALLASIRGARRRFQFWVASLLRTASPRHPGIPSRQRRAADRVEPRCATHLAGMTRWTVAQRKASREPVSNCSSAMRLCKRSMERGRRSGSMPPIARHCWSIGFRNCFIAPQRDTTLMSASLIGRCGQALSDYPPLQCRCRSRARASLRNRPQGPSIMGENGNPTDRNSVYAGSSPASASRSRIAGLAGSSRCHDLCQTPSSPCLARSLALYPTYQSGFVHTTF